MHSVNFKCNLYFTLAVVVFAVVTRVAFGQDCFTSTKRLVQAQIADIEAGNNNNNNNNNQATTEYIVCPETQINTGPRINLKWSRFLWDWPLIVLRPNITIKCGETGSRENNCILNMKRGSYLAGSFDDLESGFGVKDINVDGSKLQGFTFTGKFRSGRLGFGIVPVSSTALIHSAPGVLTVDDCAFTDISTSGVISAASNSAVSRLPIFPNESTLLIENSYFDDIKYSLFFLSSTEQNIMIRNTTFRNIQFRPLPIDEGSLRGIFGSSTYGGTIDVQDCCFLDIQYATTPFLQLTNLINNTLPNNISGAITFANTFAENLAIQPWRDQVAAWNCEEGLAFLDYNRTSETFFLGECSNPFNATACTSTASRYLPSTSISPTTTFWQRLGLWN